MSMSFIHSPNLAKCLAFGFFFELYFFNVFHMRHHMGGKLFKNDVLDAMFHPLFTFVDYVWGYSPPGWRINHHTRHHIHTNTENDPDSYGSYPGIRISEDQPLQWFHKYQTFYVPLFIPGVIFALPFHNLFVMGGSLACFILWLGTWLAMFHLHGWYGVGQYCLTTMCASLLLVYKFLVSHIHPAVGYQESDPAGAKTIDSWLRHQIEESMSWGGYIGSFLFGGISSQIEHHVSPALVPTLHSFLRPRLQDICKKHGIKYTYEPTMLHALWQFHKHLWLMGQQSSSLQSKLLESK
jgi:fatty acid desaturase